MSMRVFPLILLLACSARVAGAVPHIVNGVPTQERTTTGALLVRSDADTLFGICSGTLVGCRHFVTAAHCVCNGGDFASCGNPDPASAAVYLQHAGVLGVAAIDVNPAYDGTASDVAVLTLSAPVAGLRPTRVNAVGDPTVGMPGTIAGFGVTDGARDDFGLLREGRVTISGCGGFFPEPAMTCFTFDEPVGPPGTDSDTCFGDSGGPLFVDFGGGEVVAGVTASGTGDLCRAREISDDTNVFRNFAFIKSIGGSDLDSTACGSTTQVGDAGTAVTTRLFEGTTDAFRACRARVRHLYGDYATRELQLMRECLNGVGRGGRSGPCPDALTAARIASAAARIDAAALAHACPATLVPQILASGPCAGAADAAALAACILAAGDASVAALLDVEYADTARTAPIADGGLRTCQETIARSGASYAAARLRTLARCQASEDGGLAASCPDAAADGRLARVAGRVASRIRGACSNPQVQALDADGTFGGGCAGAGSAAALAACEVAAHDGTVDALVGTLRGTADERRLSFTVPAGTARVLVTLNGIDTIANDLDLYVRRGTPPTRAAFDARSINDALYEAIDLAAPAAGSWHAFVDPVRGRNVPFQLTVTAFR
jgi:hypothetical protein